MKKPVARLTITKDNETTVHDIVFEVFGNHLYSRIIPAIPDKRVETLIQITTGDTIQEFAPNHLDDMGILEEAAQYTLVNLKKSCDKEELLKQYKAQVEEINGGN